MKKIFLILFFIIALIGISSNITLAEDAPISYINSTPTITDKGVFHLSKYTSSMQIQSLGLINGKLLASFSTTEHAWFFKNAFTPVIGTDPAKALGYTELKTDASLLSIPPKSPCTKFKDAISAVSINSLKTLCLSSSKGGDFTLHLLPAKKDKPLSIGFGKHPILEKTRVSWIGYDGNLYIASLHPDFFADEATVLKDKTNPTVFLLKNGVRYSIPNEETYYTWFRSFKSVSVIDAKKLASYPLIKKGSYRANALIQFNNDPTIYIFQPANDPYQVYGKEIKITEEKPDKWILPDPKNKKTTIELLKRPALLRPITSPSDLIDLFGPDWGSRVVKLDPSLKSTFTIADKAFSPTQDIIFE